MDIDLNQLEWIRNVFIFLGLGNTQKQKVRFK